MMLLESDRSQLNLASTYRISHIAENETRSATNGSATSTRRQRSDGLLQRAKQRPLKTKIAAILKRWVWVMLSISAKDLENCIADSVVTSGSEPRYRSATPDGVIPVVCRIKIK